MTRSSLSKLNGFDERFAQGRAYDDAEFVKRATTLLEVKYVSEPHVIHQFHPKTSIPNQGSKLQQNTRLYKNILQNEAGNIKAHNLGKTILTETT
jgi:predicted glycosyltransferase involved in capsule biosynthesis